MPWSISLKIVHISESHCKVMFLQLYSSYLRLYSPFNRKLSQWKSYLQVLPQRISRTSWVSTFSLVLAQKRSPRMMIPVWASLILRLTKPAWPFSLQSWHLRKPCLGCCYWIPWKHWWYHFSLQEFARTSSRVFLFFNNGGKPWATWRPWTSSSWSTASSFGWPLWAPFNFPNLCMLIS